MKKKYYLFALAFAGLVLTSCGGNGSIGLNYDESDLDIDTEWVEYSVPITKVSFESGEKSISIPRGETHEYQYSIEPAKAVKAALSWSSSDETVATVSKGVVSALEVGKTTITCFNKEGSFDPISLSVEVIVPVTDIRFAQETLLADFNHQYHLDTLVRYEPSDTTETGLSWHSSNEEVATVSEDGILTTKDVTSSVTITASSERINKIIELTVEVADRTIYPDTVNVTEFESEVEIGHNFTMKAEAVRAAEPEVQVTHPEVKYYSSDPTILTVEEDTGVVHALATGIASIFATAQGKEGLVTSESKTVTVFEVKVQNIILEDIELTNRNGRSDIEIPMTYTTDRAGYEEASIPNFVYTVGDPEVATVSNGKLYAVAATGSTTLNVTETRSSASKTVNLTVGYEVDSIFVSGLTEVTIGNSITLSATSDPAGVPKELFSYSSSDESIATVTNNGVVTGVSAGEVEITVSAFGCEEVYAVTVKNPLPQHQFYVEGIGGDWTINEQYALNPDLSDSNHYYLGPVFLAANTQIKVYDYVNNVWYGSNEGYTEQGAYWKTTSEGNLLVLIEGDFYVDLYLEHGEGNHIKLYYKGSEVDPIYGHQYYAEGIGGVWQAVEQYGLKADENDANHFYLGPLSLTANTEIKVYDVVNNTWYSSNEGYTEQEGYWTTTNDGNVKTLQDGTFYIDLYVEHGEGNHLKLYCEGVQPIPDVPAEDGYYLVGSKTNWKFAGATKMSAGEGSDLAQLIGYEAEEGETFKVRGYHNEVNSWHNWLDHGDANYTVASDSTLNIYLNSEGYFTVDVQGDTPTFDYDWYLDLNGSVNAETGDIGQSVNFVKDLNDNNIYWIYDLAVSENDTLKAYNPTSKIWRGTVGQGDYWTHNDNQDMVVTVAGTYDLKLFVDYEGSMHLYLIAKESDWGTGPVLVGSKNYSGSGEEGASWDDATKAYFFTVEGGDPIEGVDKQYVADIEFVEDDEFRFRIAGSYDNILDTDPNKKDSAWNAGQITMNGDNYKVITAGTYTLYMKHFTSGGWSCYIGKIGGDTPVTSKLKFSCDLSILNDKIGGSCTSYSLYAWCSDGSKPFGSFDDCWKNLINGYVEIDYPEGKTITGIIIYLWQGDAKKQSTNIEVSITEAGEYYIMMPEKLQWVEEDNQWKFSGLTVQKASAE